MGGTSSQPVTTISPGNTLCEKIKELITPYIDLARRQPVQNIGVSAPFLKEQNGAKWIMPVLKLTGYVYLANGAIQCDSNFELPYIESIYRLAGVTNTCNGIICIEYLAFTVEGNILKKIAYKEETKNSFKPYFYFKSDGKYIYRPIVPNSDGIKYTDPDYVDILFTQKFLSQYKSCNFISIAVNLLSTDGGHSNMLLIYRETLQSNKVYLMLYEPHGAEGIRSDNDETKAQYVQMNTQFIEIVKNTIKSIAPKDVTFTQVEPYNISQEKGIQIYMNDRHGFCYIISSFWLYIILLLIKDKTLTDNPNLMLNLNYIEECVFNIIESEIKKDQEDVKSVSAIATAATSESQSVLTIAKQGSLHNYSSAEVLYSIIVHFAYDFLTKSYLKYFTPSTPDKFTKFINNFKSLYERKKKKNLVNFNKSIFIKNIDYTPATDISQKYIHEIEDLAVEKIITKLDGESCNQDDECQSHKCNENKCSPLNSFGNSQGESQADSQGESHTHSQDYYNIMPILDEPDDIFPIKTYEGSVINDGTEIKEASAPKRLGDRDVSKTVKQTSKRMRVGDPNLSMEEP